MDMDRAKQNILCGIFGACLPAIPAILSSPLAHTHPVASQAFALASLAGLAVIGGLGIARKIDAPRPGAILVGFLACPTVVIASRYLG